MGLFYYALSDSIDRIALLFGLYHPSNLHAPASDSLSYYARSKAVRTQHTVASGHTRTHVLRTRHSSHTAGKPYSRNSSVFHDAGRLVRTPSAAAQQHPATANGRNRDQGTENEHLPAHHSPRLSLKLRLGEDTQQPPP